MQFTKTLLALVSISAVGLSAPTNYNGTFSGDGELHLPLPPPSSINNIWQSQLHFTTQA